MMSIVQAFITTAVLIWFSDISVLNRWVVMAQECSQHQFDTPFTPGNSCEDIYNKNPQSRDKSGYYWILDGPSRVYCGMNYTGTSCEDIYNNYPTISNKSGFYRIYNISNEWVYCNMTEISNSDTISSCAGVGSGWKRIAGFDITAGDDCPSPWVKSSYNGVNFCEPGSAAGDCYSVIYSTNRVSYQRVCGKASGYQKGSMDGFYNGNLNDTVEGNYVDGLSITHGNPRHHIWTYAVGISDSGSYPSYNCPCAVVAGPNPPDFVGSHYYCESGTGSSWSNGVYYLSDVLWDGEGCSVGNTCCSDPNLPWFYHQLNQTTQDDIEVRMCTLEGTNIENLLMTKLELYIQ